MAQSTGDLLPFLTVISDEFDVDRSVLSTCSTLSEYVFALGGQILPGDIGGVGGRVEIVLLARPPLDVVAVQTDPRLGEATFATWREEMVRVR